VRVVSFDAGGVLIFPNWARVSAALAAHGIAITPAVLARADAYAKLAMDRPLHLSSTDNAGHGAIYFVELMKAAGVEAPDMLETALHAVKREHERRTLWESVGPDVIETLTRLRSRGAHIIVVSNSDGRLRRMMRDVGLADYFDAIVDSAEVGVEKPDPRIFSDVLASLGASASDAAHVGDFYEIDVVGARAAGMTPVLLDPHHLHAARDCVRIASLGELERE
jgi:putative hydrolase of the HAD superfamily